MTSRLLLLEASSISPFLLSQQAGKCVLRTHLVYFHANPTFCLSDWFSAIIPISLANFIWKANLIAMIRAFVWCWSKENLTLMICVGLTKSCYPIFVIFVMYMKDCKTNSHLFL